MTGTSRRPDARALSSGSEHRLPDQSIVPVLHQLAQHFGPSAAPVRVGDLMLSLLRNREGTVTEVRQQPCELLVFLPIRGTLAVTAGTSAKVLCGQDGVMTDWGGRIGLQFKPGAEIAALGVRADRFATFGCDYHGEPRCFAPGRGLFSIEDLGGDLRNMMTLALGTARASPREYEIGPLAEALERLLATALVRASDRVSDGAAWPLPEDAAPGYLTRALLFMRTHLEGEFDWAGVIANAGVTERTLRRAFVEYLGTSPMRFWTEARLDRIHEHLRLSTDARPIQQLAEAFGFRTYTAFWRGYCARFGQKPSETRAMAACR